MKVTKKQRKEFVRNKLETSRAWANKALIEIFKFQTDEEVKVLGTIEHNGVGFSGVDGEILTSLANFYLTRGYLTPKQQDLVMRKIKKYSNQIISISNVEKLDSLILKS